MPAAIRPGYFKYPAKGASISSSGGNRLSTITDRPAFNPGAPSSPYTPAGESAGGAPGGTSGATAEKLAGAGLDLMDPGSDYFKRLMDGMKKRIGKESAAAGRAAALRSAWSGMGAGASPELLDVQGDIAQSGLEAQGQAGAGLRLAAPQLGAQIAQGGGQLALGRESLEEGSRQFGAGLGEQARQFDTGLTQRQTEFGANTGLAQNAQQQQWDMFQQQMDLAMKQLYGGGGGFTGNTYDWF